MNILYAMLGGFALDWIFGDPAWLTHPVVIMGRAIAALESGLRKRLPKTPRGERLGGLTMAIVLPVGTLLLTGGVCRALAAVHPALGFAAELLWCAQALAATGLAQESTNVYRQLQKDDLPAARQAVGRIVGRDTEALTREGVIRAAVETVAENASDGVIAPGYTPEALEILKDKRKGTYNVIKIDPEYVPAPVEHKQVFGITFEQGRNEVKLDDPALFENIPTKNKTFTDEAKRDLIISLITLKYTQSNSVCYVKDGQAIGIGAGQQSRIHCTRLAGNKADIWWLRQHPKVMNLPFVDGIRRADRDNTIDVYISEEHDDVLAEGTWQKFFKEKPEVLTMEEKKAWIAKNTKVALGSDAFFPFGDNIERAHKSGVEYIAQAGGSVRDDNVIETCDKYGIAMAFTGVRLFHH